MIKSSKNKKITIIGAGLAGCEAALILARFNYDITLIDMKPQNYEGVFRSCLFGELVCSNSLRSQLLNNGAGLLKEELRILNSPLMRIADSCQINLGDSLVVNRDTFSQTITDQIKASPNIKIITQNVISFTFDEDRRYLIATGPATSEPFFTFLTTYFNAPKAYFIDATAPLIEKESIDFSKAYFKNRFDNNDTAYQYLNCPLTKSEYELFYNTLLEFANEKPYQKIFEGCMPIEAMALRGPKTLLYGPFKPIGLAAKNAAKPYAVIQLRPDNNYQSLFNIVGFQTGLDEKKQKTLITLIPALKHARVLKYGRMHASKYLFSPKLLTLNYQFKDYSHIYLIGQINGLEGYIEAIASGHVAALDIIYHDSNKKLLLDKNTMLGALMHYSLAPCKEYIPIKANYGIMQAQITNNKNDRQKQANIALAAIKKIAQDLYE